jgi:hypothetical protein
MEMSSQNIHKYCRQLFLCPFILVDTFRFGSCSEGSCIAVGPTHVFIWFRILPVSDRITLKEFEFFTTVILNTLRLAPQNRFPNKRKSNLIVLETNLRFPQEMYRACVCNCVHVKCYITR